MDIILMERQGDQYYIFANLVDVKGEQCNMRFYMQQMDDWLAQIEHHILFIATSLDPQRSSARNPLPVNYFDS